MGGKGATEDESEKLCPVCYGPMDETDLSLFPCPCGCQLCMWCLNTLVEDKRPCPMCRQEYNKDNYRTVEKKEELKEESDEESASEHKKESLEAMLGLDSDTKRLLQYRVIQRDLVYVMGLPKEESDEAFLSSERMFGQYGRIDRAMINTNASTHANLQTIGVYLTYHTEAEALLCIEMVDGYSYKNHILKASYGTTKYCTSFLEGMECTKRFCTYLHRYADQSDCFTRDMMSTNEGDFYERTHPGKGSEWNAHLKMYIYRRKSDSTNDVLPKAHIAKTQSPAIVATNPPTVDPIASVVSSLPDTQTDSKDEPSGPSKSETSSLPMSIFPIDESSILIPTEESLQQLQAKKAYSSKSGILSMLQASTPQQGLSLQQDDIFSLLQQAQLQGRPYDLVGLDAVPAEASRDAESRRSLLAPTEGLTFNEKDLFSSKLPAGTPHSLQLQPKDSKRYLMKEKGIVEDCSMPTVDVKQVVFGGNPSAMRKLEVDFIERTLSSSWKSELMKQEQVGVNLEKYHDNESRNGEGRDEVISPLDQTNTSVYDDNRYANSFDQLRKPFDDYDTAYGGYTDTYDTYDTYHDTYHRSNKYKEGMRRPFANYSSSSHFRPVNEHDIDPNSPFTIPVAEEPRNGRSFQSGEMRRSYYDQPFSAEYQYNERFNNPSLGYGFDSHRKSNNYESQGKAYNGVSGDVRRKPRHY